MPNNTLIDLYTKANRELKQARDTIGELSEQLLYSEWSKEVLKSAWQLTKLLEQKSMIYSGVAILTKHEVKVEPAGIESPLTRP